MKNVSLKKILTTAFAVMLILCTVFAISSCKKHEHTLEEYVALEPTCEEDGILRFACTDEECDYVEEEAIPAVGHSNVVSIIKSPTCTEDGSVRTRCTKCGETKTDVVAAPGHTKKTVAAKESTCTSAGYVAHEICTECDWTTLDASGIKPIKSHNKVWVDDRDRRNPEYSLVYPSCTEAGYHYEYYECSYCGLNYDDIEKIIDAPLGHDISVEKARAAGCCIGWDEFDYCNGWSSSELNALGYHYMTPIETSGPYYKNADNAKSCGYNNYVEHPAIFEHKMQIESTYVELVAATCLNGGKYQYVRSCTTCAEDWKNSWHLDAKAKYPVIVIEETGDIAPLGHAWQTHLAQDATCAVDGWKEFIMCTRCSKVDTPDGKIPVIPAGHKYDEDGCLLVCNGCGYINSENGGHKLITAIVPGVDPTCTDAGYYTCLKVCSVCKDKDGQSRVITSEVVREDALGHAYIQNNGKKPNCTEVGFEAYKTCERCDYSDFKQIDALGHTIDKTKPELLQVVRKASCTYDGLEKYGYICSVCNQVAETYNVTLPMLDHTVVKVAEKAATCTTNGRSAYEYCGKCGVTIVESVSYAKLGHDYIDVEAKAATCTEDGWYQHIKCQRDGCDDNTKVVIPASHTIITVPAQAPTCTEVGWNDYTICGVCKANSTSTYKKNELPATGHHEADPVVEVTKAPTCTATGLYDVAIYCKDCPVELDRKVGLVSAALGHEYAADGKCVRFSACGERYSAGLSYFKNLDGTYVVTGRGSCQDTEIIIPDMYNGMAVVAIADEAFRRDEKITSLKIGNNVTSIGIDAFYRCENLKTVTIGASVKSVGDSAFNLCTAITTVRYNGSNWAGISFAGGNTDLTSKYK